MPAPLLALALACAAPEPAPVFVRGGIAAPGGPAGARRLPDGRALVERAWSPGEPAPEARGAPAPAIASCVTLFHRDLGDVSRHVARGGEPPDAALALSPDGGRLAWGTFTGEVGVLDAWTGALAARRRLPEALVKGVAWSPDGATLYAAEQSPDAYVHALDPATLAPRWSLRLADRVGTSAPPAADDLYGAYTLPAAYGLVVLDGGDLLVAAVHGWSEDGVRLNRAQLLRVDPAGEVVATWPAEPADATLWHPRVDEEGGVVALAVGRSAAGPDPADLPVGGVQLLALDGLRPLSAVVPEPLRPWFDRAFVWEALDVDVRRDLLYAGLGDGRVLTWTLGGEPRARVDLGVPLPVGGAPVSASVGHGLLRGGVALTVTAGTHIPYGAASPALRPPAAHPAENALWAHDAAGRALWTWRGPHALGGLALSPDGRTLVVGAGPRRGDERVDLFGALAFDLDAPGDGLDRLAAVCPTAGPAWIRLVAADDGRIFLVEHPWLRADGAVVGAWRLTGLR